MEGGDQRGRLPKGPEPRRKRYGASNDELARLSSRGEVSPVIIDGQHQHPFGLQDFDYEMGSPTKDAQPPLSLRSCLLHEPLLLLTLLGVVLGVLLGGLLRYAHLGPTAIDLIGFPGELMLRLLKMLVLPLVSMSMVSGMCSLRENGSAQSMARLAKLTAAFYVTSTLLAIALGLLLVVVIRPGRGAAFNDLAASSGCGSSETAQQQAVASTVDGGGSTTTQAMLQVARMIVPDNIVKAAVDMNVLGILFFSLLFGWALSSLGPQAEGVIAAVHTLNAAIGKMVTAAVWVSPLGVGSLVAASMLRACSLGGTLAALGLWVATVVLGLLLFAAIIIPGALVLLTGQSPLRVASHFGQAALFAFGTSSSAASLPLAMAGAREAGCADAVVSFFLPLGISINMTGTALYEATTAVFIAQAHGVHLGIAQMVVVAVTASLAAVGAPAIPSAGLVTMLIVLQAVGLDQFSGDLAVILAVDWILDRLRTLVNLMGDAFGCVVVDSLMRRGGAVAQQTAAYQNLELGVRGVEGIR